MLLCISFIFMLLFKTRTPLYFLVVSVCSSAPVSMKIKPLNQSALMVSWERPKAVYHPPITSYMVSYSWVRQDVADEKTFTKTGDQSMVCIKVSSAATHNCSYRSKAVFQTCLPGYGFNSSDCFAESLMYQAGSQSGLISDSVYRRWQLVMNSALDCRLIWEARQSSVAHLSENRHGGLSHTLTRLTDIYVMCWQMCPWSSLSLNIFHIL